MMTTGPLGGHGDEDDDVSATGTRRGHPVLDDRFPDPSAGMVLHRVLAMSARTFLLNDLGVPADAATGDGTGTVADLGRAMGPRPLWAQSAVESLRGTERRGDPIERIHQSRVAMRRIRSNLRTFRLLCDPAWGTSLRAELAWYGNELGASRDLDLLAAMVAERGPDVLAADEVARLVAVVEWRRAEVAGRVAAGRRGERHLRLTEQMLVLWEGPAFRAKAGKAATEVLPPMLHRSWHDLRGVARKARKAPTDVHLHQLRIRLKDLRYGSETLALVEGGRARKAAKAAERLQSKLGDLHDLVFATAWLEALAAEQPDLADAAERLAARQREAAVETRRGWKRDLKEVERRWRRWQG
jgi:CHAD domain-containing protein